MSVHADVSEAVDSILNRKPVRTEFRWVDNEDRTRKEIRYESLSGSESQVEEIEVAALQDREQSVRVFPFGINRARLELAAKRERTAIQLVDNVGNSDLFLTTRTHYRRKPQRILDAEALGIPVYVLKGNDVSQLRQCLRSLSPGLSRTGYVHRLQEVLNGRRGDKSGSAGPGEGAVVRGLL